MHHPTDRIIHTMAFVKPVVEHWLEREIAQWVHPMKDRSDDLSHHERTLFNVLRVQWSHKIFDTNFNVLESSGLLKPLDSHFNVLSDQWSKII